MYCLSATLGFWIYPNFLFFAQKLYQKIIFSYDPHLQHFTKLDFVDHLSKTRLNFSAAKTAIIVPYFLIFTPNWCGFVC